MEKVIVGIVLGVIVLAFIFAGTFASSMYCSYKWDEYKTRFDVFTGCKVEVN